MRHKRSRLNKKFKLHIDYANTKNLRKIKWQQLPLLFIKQYKRQILWLSCLIIAIVLLIPLFTYIYFAKDLKNKDTIMNRSKTGLTLLDQDGNQFFTFNQTKTITYVPISDIPTVAQQAVVAAEDKNFYTNPGFSIRGMLRAFLVNIFAGKVVEGGSTITQELAKNAFLSASRNILRKYQELVLASELNRRFSKQDILEMYLNSVYFGEGAFGIENAAEAYFGIHANQMDLAQSTLLIAILPAPSALSPLSNDPSAAIKRQHTVLQQMVDQKYITPNQAAIAEQEQLTYNPVKQTNTNKLAPHFAIYVKDLLFKQYGEERVIRDGFVVKTTLNSDWQEYAEKAVKNQVISLQRNNASNGAAVVIDPKTGEIKVMVGSYDWNDPNFGKTNMAITPRQPGSSFKPIIYSDALQKKIITPQTILQDEKTTFPGNYTPQNYDHQFRGPVTVRRALANSLNIPAVEVMEKLGVPDGLSQAQRLGITTLDTNASKYGLSLVLGSGEVKLLELTDAYAVFADQGVYHEPKAIETIKDKYGNIVDDNKKGLLYWLNPLNWFKQLTSNQGKSVLDAGAAYLISSILSDNSARAEEFGSALTIARTAAVKTGTTNDFRDALTIGYTPSLVVGVWVGNNNNTPMDNIAGSLGAAPIWRNLMNTFLLGKPLETFTQPDNVVSVQLCTSTGYRLTRTDYFISGTEPQSCGYPTYTPMPTTTQSPTPTPTQQPTETPTPTLTPTPTTIAPTPTTGPIIPTQSLPTVINIP